VTDPQFPAAQPGDSDDVVLALETARVLFLSGETEEAVVRLRRAAEAAQLGGNNQRAHELSRAAADLTREAGDVSALPPVQPASGAATRPPPPPRGAPGPPSTRPAAPSTREATGGQARQSRPPPLPPSARRPPTSDETLEAEELEVAPVEPEAAAGLSASFPPPGQPAAAPGSPGPASATGRSSPPPSAQTQDGAPKPLLSKRPPKPDQAKRSMTPPPVAGPVAMGDSTVDRADLARAVRVAIKPSSRDEGLLMMRLLKPGEEPAPGYRPALVLMLESDGAPSGK
jgi:hypothetical protein